MITFEHTSFTYDDKSFALDGIDLSIKQGQLVFILGGNGSGKSTLAKHINALLVPDKGSVTVDGKDTCDPDVVYLIRSKAGMVFQNPDDQLVASLIENDVAFGPENLGIPSDEIRERVTAALKQVGLQGFETNETNALSGGQKQRVAIAGILAMEPKILILDEASAMLDPRGRKGLKRVYKKLQAQGMTIVAITHFMEEATEADRVVVLDQGRVVCDGIPEEVLTQSEQLASLNLEVPFSVELSHLLQQQGVPVKTTLHEAELKEELCQLLLTK